MPTDLVQLTPLRTQFGFEIYNGASSTYESLKIIDHSHQNPIISVVLQGEVDFNGWKIVPGEFMYHPARLPFSEINHLSGWHLWMEFSLDTIKISNRPAKGKILNIEEYKQSFESLSRFKTLEGFHTEAALSSTFYRLFANLIDFPRDMNRPPHVERSIQQMESNYDQPLSRESLADLVGFHPNAFDRAFKQSEGIPPMEYLRQIRLGAFKKLLLDTNLTLEEISLRCGLSSAAYASRFFKQITGLNPTEYRKGVKKTRVGYYSE
jgi:AraC-like DNA-binding protein